jgi:hypothetical protein
VKWVGEYDGGEEVHKRLKSKVTRHKSQFTIGVISFPLYFMGHAYQGMDIVFRFIIEV